MAKQKQLVIDLPYKPRPLQKAIHDELWNNGKRFRFACLAIHRRFGKTVFAINELIAAALTCPHPRPRCFYISPTAKQARSIAWDYIKEFTAGIPSMKFSETELTATFPTGARIQLLGAESFENIRGNYVDAVVLDEWGNMNPRIWKEVLRPAMADRIGWCIWLGTPNGMNHFHDTYQEAEATDGWYARTFAADETGLIPNDELLAARKTMGEEEYRQEFLCDWTAATRGAFYGHDMSRVREEGRFCLVPHAQSIPVDVSFDLGIDDATAVWYVQCVGNEIRLIDYQEWTNIGLQEILIEMSRKPYIYGEAILPHDAKVREMISGKSRVETFENSDMFMEVSVVPIMKVQDGVNAVRQILPQCFFNRASCDLGVIALENYRKKSDPKNNNQFLDSPIHDKFSHGADSFRYLALHYHPQMGDIQARANIHKVMTSNHGFNNPQTIRSGHARRF